MLKAIERILARIGDPYSHLEDDIETSVVNTEFESIIAEELAERQPSDAPELINFMGLTASGKTTQAMRYLAKYPGHVFVAFDDIMEKLSHYRCDFEADREKAFLRWEIPARAMGYVLLDRAIERRLPVVFEHSNSMAEHVELYHEIEAMGYQIHIRYLNAPLALLLRRLPGRMRYFSPEKIIERQRTVEQILGRYKEIAGDRFMKIEISDKPRRLVVVRHGNTFEDGETPRRIGARTDIPLVQKGRAISVAAAAFVKNMGIHPDRIFAAPLLRSMETAEIISREIGFVGPVSPAREFVEVDYGPDENKTDDELKERLGRVYLANEGEKDNISQVRAITRGGQVLEEWDKLGVVPKDWPIDVDAIRQSWSNFSAGIKPEETVLLVTSNGVIRFAPCILAEGADIFSARLVDMKVSVGKVCIFEDDGTGWHCVIWNNQLVS